MANESQGFAHLHSSISGLWMSVIVPNSFNTGSGNVPSSQREILHFKPRCWSEDSWILNLLPNICPAVSQQSFPLQIRRRLSKPGWAQRSDLPQDARPLTAGWSWLANLLFGLGHGSPCPILSPTPVQLWSWTNRENIFQLSIKQLYQKKRWAVSGVRCSW